MGGILLAGQLLLQGVSLLGFARLLEDAMAIMIECQGSPVLLQHLLHQQEVARGILFVANHRRGQLAGGIIDGRDQRELRTTLL